MVKILALLTPEFVDKLEGVLGDLVRFVWPTKADTIVQIIGSVLGAALVVLAAFAS